MARPAFANVVSLYPELPPEGQQFVLWWYKYPRKVGKDAALRAWARLGPEDRAAAAEKLPAHVAHWQLSGTLLRFVPYPATWLNQRRWEDELDNLDSPLSDLGQCCWNRNGKREPGTPQCAARAVTTDQWGNVYCAEHGKRLGLRK